MPLSKVCNHCKVSKSISEFHKNNRAVGSQHSVSKRCKECCHLFYLRHGDKRREKYREYSRNWSRKRRAEIRAFMADYKGQHPCVDCGEVDPVVLEFDHVRGEKVGDLNGLVRTMRSDEVIAAEIAKCDIRCANCHRRRHFAAGNQERPNVVS